MIWIKETYVNETEHHGIGESEVYETNFEHRGELYRSLQSEYGRCAGKVYVGEGTPIGWVFEGRDRYEDTDETYLRHVWVTLHSEPDTVTRTPHYL